MYTAKELWFTTTSNNSTRAWQIWTTRLNLNLRTLTDIQVAPTSRMQWVILRGAIVDYQKAINLDPEDSIAHNNLGLLQEKLGYKEKAKKNYERADQLADVDKLLNKIRKEQRNESIEQEQQKEAPKEASHQEREELSIVAILRNTFLTKSGFKEYLAFIRNGFKRQ